MEWLLETKNLTKQYGTFCALSHVDVHVKRGAIYALIGRNGAGKTTLLKLVGGLSRPSEGQVYLFGKTGRELDGIRGRIGSLIESPGLYPNLSARENLTMKAILLGMNERAYVDQLLRTVGLEDVGSKKVKKFSMGMKQRLGIAMALVGEPDLLVLDEPINGLDPKGMAEIRDLILQLRDQREMTVVISSHILGELSKISTHYGILDHGELVQETSAEELEKRCSHRIEIVLDEPKLAVPVLDEMGIRKYQVVDDSHLYVFERQDESMEIGRQLLHHNVPMREIFVTKGDLEEYFLHVTGGERHVERN